MHLEVDDGDIRRALADDLDQLYGLVGSTDGADHVGVIAGIGMGGTILHAVAAHKGNTLGFAAGDLDGGFLHIGNRQRDGVGDAVKEIVVIMRIVGEEASGTDFGTGMGMRAGNEYGFVGDVVILGGTLADDIHLDLTDADHVEADDGSGLFTVGKGYGMGLQGIDDAVCAALFKVTRDSGTKRRGDIQSCKSGFHVVSILSSGKCQFRLSAMKSARNHDSRASTV